MTCQEFNELAASYALGALDADERAACEAHLAQAEHEGCREALADAGEVAASLALALPPVKPSPELWGRIAAELGDGAAKQSVPPTVTRRRGAPWWVAGAGWAAAAALAVGVVMFRNRNEDTIARFRVTERALNQEMLTRGEAVDRCRRELQGVKLEHEAQVMAIALLEHPDTRVIALGRQKDGTGENATIIFHQATSRAVVVGQGLTPPAGKDYELWVIKGDQKIAAGLVSAGQDGRISYTVDTALLQGVDTFAITLEPAGGGPVPRGSLVLAGKV